MYGGQSKPLTDAELHRLGVLVAQASEIGTCFDLGLDRTSLGMVQRLVDAERSRRARRGRVDEPS